MIPFPNKKYNIIYTDPPWHFSNWSGKGTVKAPINHYQTMSLKDICKLPVKDVADKDCVLFIWTCDPLLNKVFEVIKCWGFTYKTMGFVWVKINKHKVAKTIMARATIHSKKPEIVKDKIVELCGDLPRIELFARNVGLFSDGWDVWGNEV